MFKTFILHRYVFLSSTESIFSYSILVDCKWDNYGEWSSCSKTCGGGKQTRTRTKIRDKAQGGEECTGTNTDARDCNTEACPGS